LRLAVFRSVDAIEHLGSLLVEADEVVFSVMRARSESVLREVNQRAHMPVDRVAAVSQHGFGTGSRKSTHRDQEGTEESRGSGGSQRCRRSCSRRS
jgi:hypothetical protein